MAKTRWWRNKERRENTGEIKIELSNGNVVCLKPPKIGKTVTGTYFNLRAVEFTHEEAEGLMKGFGLIT